MIVYVVPPRRQGARARNARAGRTPARGVATVTLENAGVPLLIRLDLVRLAVGWRIRDTHVPSGDLRAVHDAMTRAHFILGFGREPETMA
jgi:hypothetical protein